ncbi:hypothetical protein [Burkholderia cepacia]|uniref:hypothetical protein n=1 Tax=Burkholderia cepacia TaxID=292 RepID=UPI00157731F8|nr:hypothetical protein [Burkholderia cepacia]
MKIAFELVYGQPKKKVAIEAIRFATGLGAKEATEFVERGFRAASRQHPTRVIMTDAQFGRLVAYIMKDPAIRPIVVCCVEILDDPVMCDFTQLEGA